MRNVWYVAVNDGVAVVKSRDYDIIEDYCAIKNDEGAAESAEEYGYELGSPNSYWQNGYDGGFYDIGKVKVTDKDNLLIITRESGDYDITKDELEDVEEITEDDI